MEFLSVIVMAMLSSLIAALICKIRLMRKSIREITGTFHKILTAETNALIGISSRDPRLLELASEINDQLRLLRDQRRRFQQGDRELKEAVANLSHDLRTPLTAIRGYLDLLDREEKSEAVERYFAHIRNRTEALTSLTEELFRYSIAASAQAPNPERLDLVRALEESLLSFYGAMRERGIEPEIRLPEGPVWRELDKAAVNRVFSNIIGNALKYSDGDLSVDMDDQGRMTFTNVASSLNVVAVGRMFDRFFTVEAARNSTGLGLSIAKVLTERMGGSISAEYRDNRVWIRLAFRQ